MRSGAAHGRGAQDGLAPYAVRPALSRGRLIAEPDCPTRNPFQRDRDRIIHSTAFRRLTHKTQVFIYHEGDHYRTRLTHSLEVAQIARTMARQLGLQEDLAEALALAHDLGHPPFGHAGERALDAAAHAHGGFDHNAQSLRVVTAIERKYARFDGLNLTWETLEGLVKHNGPLRIGGGEAVQPDIAAYDARHSLDLHTYPSAEAQVAAIADDIAYNNHDLDDGLRAGILSLDRLREVPLAARFIDEVRAVHGDLAGPRMIYEVNRRLITAMIADAVNETLTVLGMLKPRSAHDIRKAPVPAVAFSDAMSIELDELRFFLLTGLYRHPRVMEQMHNAEQIVRDLYGRYMEDPGALPEHWRAAAEGLDERAWARHIIDFVAGMTDRFAYGEHRRLFDATPELD